MKSRSSIFIRISMMPKASMSKSLCEGQLVLSDWALNEDKVFVSLLFTRKKKVLNNRIVALVHADGFFV